MKNGHLAQELTQQLIICNTSESRGIDHATELLRDWCESAHLTVKSFSGTRALLIETNPKSQNKICFVCHVDVVPASGWRTAFQPRIENGYLFGRGVVDDLGPLSICLEVLLHRKKSSTMNVSCLVVTDEESHNTEIQRVIKCPEFMPTICLVVDGGSHREFDIGQKGIVQFQVEIHTSGGHSAFEVAESSASEQLLRFIASLKKTALKMRHHPTFSAAFVNVSRIHSETVPFGLPALAKASIELQFPLPQRSQTWLRRAKVLASNIRSAQITVNWTSEPHLLTDKNLLQLFASIPNSQLITTGGNNLAKDLMMAGIPAISHCPVSEYIAHCPDEKMQLNDFRKGVEEYLDCLRILEQAVR